MIIKFTGTDVLLLNKFPRQLPLRKLPYVLMYRLAVWLSKFSAEGFEVDHQCLLKEVSRFGIKKATINNPTIIDIVYPKQKHEGFNILYYRPITKYQKFNDWIYGYDIFLQVKRFFGNSVKFIEVDGSQIMGNIYPITDFYLRCNRHDGASRMRLECELNKIPNYWSYENPSVFEIVEKIKKLKKDKELL